MIFSCKFQEISQNILSQIFDIAQSQLLVGDSSHIIIHRMIGSAETDKSHSHSSHNFTYSPTIEALSHI